MITQSYLWNDADPQRQKYQIRTAVQGADGVPVAYTVANLRIGQVLADGWIYGGMSPVTHTPLAWAPGYLMDGLRIRWDEAVNAAHLAPVFGYPWAGIGTLFDLARQTKAQAGGARLPAVEELVKGFQKRNVIGGFMPEPHWALDQHRDSHAAVVDFRDGARHCVGQSSLRLARCVRTLGAYTR